MADRNSDKINYIETCLDDIGNFIKMYRDGEYNDDAEFWSDIAVNATSIHDEAIRD